VRSSGHVYATGQAKSQSLEESYQKSAHSPAPASAGSIKVELELPHPSYVGQGVGTEVTISGSLQGAARSVINRGGTSRTENHVAAAQPIFTHRGDPDEADSYSVTLRFDPNPGKPSGAEVADLSKEIRDSLSLPNGELGLAIRGTFLGSALSSSADGRPAICYARKFSGESVAGEIKGSVVVEVSYCGWFTTGADKWEPKTLSPADAATPPKL
jgi:hypothetical protein